jgi:cell wall-associated NlpC family hydrolase
MSAAILFSASARATTEDQDDTLGAKIKRLFTGPAPTPTPTPRRKRPIHRTKPTPTPTETPAGSPAAESAQSETPATTPNESPSPTPIPTESPLPMIAETPGETNPTPIKSRESNANTQYFEPVRPINPGPHARPRPRRTPAPTPIETPPPTSRPTPLQNVTESPAETPLPSATPTPRPSLTSSATPKPTLTPKATATPTPTPKPTPKPTATPTPTPKKGTGKVSTISSAEISGYEKYSPEVRKIVDLALDLTTQSLAYKYNSADPARGGMDCSGFIYYVLTKSGVGNVPRDAREQYFWVRKSGNFQAVLSQRDDSFELDALKPGDLLFWASPYGVSRDPEIAQTMIYLGRDKKTNQRIMVGAAEGRSYKGQSRSGVSVFDFKPSRLSSKSDKEPGSSFVGYGRVPGLSGE